MGEDASCCSKYGLQRSLLEDIVVVSGALVVFKCADEGLQGLGRRKDRKHGIWRMQVDAEVLLSRML
jgi:hypothetical protein